MSLELSATYQTQRNSYRKRKIYSKSEQFRAVFSIDDQQSPFLDLYDDVERQQTSPRDPQKNIALCLAANSREKLQSAVEFMLPAGAYSRCP